MSINTPADFQRYFGDDDEHGGGDIPDLTAVAPLVYASGSGTLSITAAGATSGGYVTTAAQTFSGRKSFAGINSTTSDAQQIRVFDGAANGTIGISAGVMSLSASSASIRLPTNILALGSTLSNSVSSLGGAEFAGSVLASEFLTGASAIDEDISGNLELTSAGIITTPQAFRTGTSLQIGAVTEPVITKIDIDDALTADSDTRVPTQAAVKAYVDNHEVGGTFTVIEPLNWLAPGNTDLQLVNDVGTQITMIDPDDTLTANADDRIATQKAVREFHVNSFANAITWDPVANEAKLKNNATPLNDFITGIDVDPAMAANSDTLIPTQAAVRGYIGTISHASPVTFTGALGNMTLTQLAADVWAFNQRIRATALTTQTSAATLDEIGADGRLSAAVDLYLSPVGLVRTAQRIVSSNASAATSATTGGITCAGGIGLVGDVYCNNVLVSGTLYERINIEFRAGATATSVACTTASYNNMPLLTFAGNVDQSAVGSFTLPRNWKVGTTISFYWHDIATGVPSNTVGWQVLISATIPGGAAFAAGASIYSAYTASLTIGKDNLRGPADYTPSTAGTVISYSLIRLGSVDSDNVSHGLLGAYVECQVDRLAA